jgi:hypothetical protein
VEDHAAAGLGRGGDDRGGEQPAGRDVLTMRWNGIASVSVLASGVASSSAGMSSESRPVKFAAPRRIRLMSRWLGVARTSPHVMCSQISRPVASSASPSGRVAAT